MGTCNLNGLIVFILEIIVKDDPVDLGKAAAKLAAQHIRESIAKNGQANIILATGASQFETLRELVKESNLEWNKVVMFHLDEYIGLSDSHPASFRKYLRERFLDKIQPLKAVYLIDGNADPSKECIRLSDLIKSYPIDIALVGVGENAHLAFNDPPADFDTKDPYLVVELELQCRQQQVAEGWFDSLENVPLKAISMSVQQIMSARNIVCSVPGQRKANAILRCFQNPVSNLFPASILQLHPRCHCFLDRASAQSLMIESAAR